MADNLYLTTAKSRINFSQGWGRSDFNIPEIHAFERTFVRRERHWVRCLCGWPLIGSHSVQKRLPILGTVGLLLDS